MLFSRGVEPACDVAGRDEEGVANAYGVGVPESEDVFASVEDAGGLGVQKGQFSSVIARVLVVRRILPWFTSADGDVGGASSGRVTRLFYGERGKQLSTRGREVSELGSALFKTRIRSKEEATMAEKRVPGGFFIPQERIGPARDRAEAR